MKIVEMKETEIRFDRLFRYDRTMVPSSVCVPFPEGVLTEDRGVEVTDGGAPVPVQTKVTSRYSDGSVRYLLVRLMCDLPGNEKKTLKLRILPECPQAKDGFISAETDGGIDIDNGVIKASVRDGSGTLFTSFDSSRAGFSPALIEGPVFREGGNLYGVCFEHWEIEENGPLYSRVTGSGRFTGKRDIRFEVRLDLHKGKPFIQAGFRLINTTSEPLIPDLLSFSVHGNKNAKALRTLTGRSNYKTSFRESGDAERLFDSITASDILNSANEHMNEVFYGAFFSDSTFEDGGVTASVFQAFQNFPKAVGASKDGVTAYLIPERDEDDSGKGPLTQPVTFAPGMSREQKFMLYFHGADETKEKINDIALEHQLPDRPGIDPSVFREAKVMPEIFPGDMGKNSEFECALIYMADHHTRTYGMMDFGDVPDDHYTSQGRGHGRTVWSNNEYDFPHAMFMMYARSGERRFLDCGEAFARHWMDVDVCHYSEDPFRTGGQWEHSAGHNGGQVMVCSHEWVEGLLDLWHFTGDKRALDTALGIGENVLKLLTLPEYRTPGESNARENGWALRTLTALYDETGDERWLSESGRITEIFYDWEKRYGALLSPYTDNTLIRVPFMISVAIGSLMRYYRLFPDEGLKGLILRATEDLVEECLLDNGSFYYKDLPSLRRISLNPLLLEAMVYGYELSGDRKYLEAGLVTFRRNIQKNTGGDVSSTKRAFEDAVVEMGRSTKHFAQAFLPMALFARALEKEGMSPDL